MVLSYNVFFKFIFKKLFGLYKIKQQKDGIIDEKSEKGFSLEEFDNQIQITFNVFDICSFLDYSRYNKYHYDTQS